MAGYCYSTDLFDNNATKLKLCFNEHDADIEAMFEDVEVPYYVEDLYEILDFVLNFSLSGSSLNSVEPVISGQ